MNNGESTLSTLMGVVDLFQNSDVGGKIVSSWKDNMMTTTPSQTTVAVHNEEEEMVLLIWNQMVKAVAADNSRCDRTMIIIGGTIMLWVFRNVTAKKKSFYDLKPTTGTKIGKARRRHLPSGILRILSAVLVSKIVSSVLPRSIYPGSVDVEGDGEDSSSEYYNDTTTKLLANYFVTGLSSIVFEIISTRMKMKTIISTIVMLLSMLAGIVIVIVINSDNKAFYYSLLPKIGYKNDDDDSIEILIVLGLCLLLLFAGWYCYNCVISRIVGYHTFLSSFPCFIIVLATFTIPSLQEVIFKGFGFIWELMKETIILLSQ